MLETDVSHSRVSSPFRDESGEEELSVLPRNTKVIVTGNNRTKSVLVGLQGVVKKAVGLGGWHWLVLKNGIEVKLQRNALSVIEPPSANEDNDTHEFDHSSSGTDTDEKEHQQLSSGSQLRKVSKRKVQFSRPLSRSPPRKSINRSICRVQSKRHTAPTGVNLAKLGTESLLRYWRRFNLGKTHPNPTRQQLIDAVQQHFDSQKVDEEQVIMEFVSAAKRLHSVDKRERLDDQLKKNDSVP